jgi:hypothetical protein
MFVLKNVEDEGWSPVPIILSCIPPFSYQLNNWTIHTIQRFFILSKSQKLHNKGNILAVGKVNL